MPQKRGPAGISDEKVKEKTGRGWTKWFKLLDRWGGKEKAHPEIAKHLEQVYGVSPWWAQTVTNRYEQERRGRDVGQLPDGSYRVNFQRTVETTPGKAYDAFTQPEHLNKWFTSKAKVDLKVGGRYSNGDRDQGQFLKLEQPKRLRFTWDNAEHCPGTIVQVDFVPRKGGKVAIQLEHSKLASKADYEDMKDGWAWAMDSLKSYLETGQGIPHEEWMKKNV